MIHGSWNKFSFSLHLNSSILLNKKWRKKKIEKKKQREAAKRENKIKQIIQKEKKMVVKNRKNARSFEEKP